MVARGLGGGRAAAPASPAAAARDGGESPHATHRPAAARDGGQSRNAPDWPAAARDGGESPNAPDWPTAASTRPTANDGAEVRSAPARLAAHDGCQGRTAPGRPTAGRQGRAASVQIKERQGSAAPDGTAARKGRRGRATLARGSACAHTRARACSCTFAATLGSAGRGAPSTTLGCAGPVVSHGRPPEHPHTRAGRGSGQRRGAQRRRSSCAGGPLCLAQRWARAAPMRSPVVRPFMSGTECARQKNKKQALIAP